MILKMKIEFWWEDKEVVEHQIKSTSLAWMTVAPAAEWFLWAHTVGPGCSHFPVWTTESALICVKIEIVHVCVCRHAWEKCVLYCMSESDFSVCQWRCVCVYMCVRACARIMEGGGRAGIKHARSTSQRLGGPPSCYHGHTCKLDYPKNRSVEHNTLTHTHTDRHTCTSINSKNRSLPVAPVPCRPVCDPRSTLPRTSSCRTDTSSGLEQQD